MHAHRPSHPAEPLAAPASAAPPLLRPSSARRDRLSAGTSSRFCRRCRINRFVPHPTLQPPTIATDCNSSTSSLDMQLVPLFGTCTTEYIDPRVPPRHHQSYPQTVTRLLFHTQPEVYTLMRCRLFRSIGTTGLWHNPWRLRVIMRRPRHCRDASSTCS